MADTTEEFFSIRIEDRGSVRIVRLVGELDITSYEAVEAVLSDTAPLALVVDLFELSFIDASGVRALSKAHEHARRLGGSIAIRGARGLVLRVLRVTDATYLLANGTH